VLQPQPWAISTPRATATAFLINPPAGTMAAYSRSERERRGGNPLNRVGATGFLRP
jgi:hypothetical protein